MRSTLLVLTAFAALADAAIVILALPGILVDLHTTVYGVSAVIGLYTAGVAVAIPAAHHVFRRAQPAPERLGALSCMLFGLGAITCALSPSVAVLLVGRGLQAIGAGVILLVVFEELQPSVLGRKIWTVLSVFALAAGPAVGGALTQALGWRSIFFVQAPLGFASAAALILTRNERPGALQTARPRLIVEDRRQTLVAGIALTLLSGALTAVLFLLVLLLVTGWAESPISAALVVSILPIATVAGSRLPGSPHRRALAGLMLVAAGTAPLAFLPTSDTGWVVAPEIIAGLGIGLASRGLAGGLLPETTRSHAARLLTLRHAGITVALIALAPVVAHDLRSATEDAKLRGVALVLDAPISPAHKLAMAPSLVGTLKDQQPRRALRQAAVSAIATVAPDERAAARAIAKRADTVLVRAVGQAFRNAFLIAAALALLAAGLLAVQYGEILAFVAGAGLVLLAGGAQYAAQQHWQPRPVHLADPCTAAAPPSSGGLSGQVQRDALTFLNKAACHFHSSREELLLALTSSAEAQRFKSRYGSDPRSASTLIRALLGR